MQVSTIIVTFNSSRHIDNCLASVLKDHNPNLDNKILIIDNHSSDNTVSILKKFKKSVYIIENSRNLGFAQAVNQGINYVRSRFKSEYYFLLNPDTIIKKNTYNNLLKSFSNPEVGIVGGKTINKQGEVSGSCFRKPNIWVGAFDFTNLRKLDKTDRWHNYFYYKDKNLNSEMEVDVVTGGFMMIRKCVVEEIGVFDKRYFMYLEDVDYCIRCSEWGYKIIYNPKAVIVHEGGGSSNNKYKINHSAWLSSRKKFYLKHFSILDNLVIQPLFFVDDVIITLKNFYENIRR